ncbi:hypothetical protein YW7DRAFT_05055 [Streptomyces sp. AmelKG-E11A]|nr:hypothetical protein YW7DRAFT_05055 [Streptomyces sp. AmelKG-E11A]
MAPRSVLHPVDPRDAAPGESAAAPLVRVRLLPRVLTCGGFGPGPLTEAPPQAVYVADQRGEDPKGEAVRS